MKLLEYQFEKDSIPGHLCFRRLINKEFTPEVIDKIRSLENALPDLNLIERQINKKEKKDISYEYFIDGAREYIKFLDNLKFNPIC